MLHMLRLRVDTASLRTFLKESEWKRKEKSANSEGSFRACCYHTLDACELDLRMLSSLTK